MPTPPIIAISGIMGSGKTTLAKGLCFELGLTYIPESPHGLRYLKDLFDEPKKWAFEAQTAFLAGKAAQLANALVNNQSVVLDRSLHEDIRIFAKYFFDVGYIDQRAFETYSILADHFIQKLPIPTVIIGCLCSLSSVEKRTNHREKHSGSMYPPGHLRTINSMYQNWFDSLDWSLLFFLDSESVDWRHNEVIRAIAMEVDFIISNFSSERRQLTPSSSIKLKYLVQKLQT